MLFSVAMSLGSYFIQFKLPKQFKLRMAKDAVCSTDNVVDIEDLEQDYVDLVSDVLWDHRECRIRYTFYRRTPTFANNYTHLISSYGEIAPFQRLSHSPPFCLDVPTSLCLHITLYSYPFVFISFSMSSWPSLCLSVSLSPDKKIYVFQNTLKREVFLKILVLGDLGVGKTSLIRRYTNEASEPATPDYKVSILLL